MLASQNKRVFRALSPYLTPHQKKPKTIFFISVGSCSVVSIYLSVLFSQWHNKVIIYYFIVSWYMFMYLSIWEGGSCLYVIFLGMWRDVSWQPQCSMTLFGILDVTSCCPWWNCITSDWLSEWRTEAYSSWIYCATFLKKAMWPKIWE